MIKDPKILKNPLIYIGTTLLLGAWALFSDVFTTGANVKFDDRVIIVIKSKDAKHYIDSLIYDAIDREMNDPFALLDILSSDGVGDFAKETKEEFRKELLKEDSIKGDFVHDLGSSAGIRNDEVMKDLGELLKAFKEGRLYTTRTIRANF